jgi:uncharacterized protein (TIGR02270 family)
VPLHRDDFVRGLAEQHAEELAHLWDVRQRAVDAPHYDAQDLRALDRRVRAHLEALLYLGAAGETAVAGALEQTGGAPGELFAATLLALAGNSSRLHGLTSPLGLHGGEGLAARVGALGWLPTRRVLHALRVYLGSEDARVRLVGVSGAGLHRLDVDAGLARLLAEEPEPRVRARALRNAGEMGRRDLLGPILAVAEEGEDDCRFWGDWAAALLGDGAARQRMAQWATGSPSVAGHALGIAAPLFGPVSLEDLLAALPDSPHGERLRVMAAGWSGLPMVVDWLLDQMDRPHLARLAGEALALLLGLDLEGEGLEAESPGGEIADDDPDADLRWPAPERVREWWRGNRARFDPSLRYLAGRPREPAMLGEVLRIGSQPQRALAARVRSLLAPGTPLVNVGANGLW